MFKSQLQEYAQKARFSAPIYTVSKEGPSHQPQFRASVTIQGETYESPNFCTNLKSAEHAAAKAALVALGAKADSNTTSPSTLHESGLCKSLLQEYTQKRKLPLPLYTVIQTSFEKNIPYFCATVEIDGIQYKGGVSKNRKNDAILAAQAALIAIYSDPGQQATISQQNTVTEFVEVPSTTSNPRMKRKKPSTGTQRSNKERRIWKLNKDSENVKLNAIEAAQQVESHTNITIGQGQNLQMTAEAAFLLPGTNAIPGITVTNLKLPEQDFKNTDPTLIPSPNSNNQPLQFSSVQTT